MPAPSSCRAAPPVRPSSAKSAIFTTPPMPTCESGRDKAYEKWVRKGGVGVDWAGWEHKRGIYGLKACPWAPFASPCSRALSKITLQPYFKQITLQPSFEQMHICGL